MVILEFVSQGVLWGGDGGGVGSVGPTSNCCLMLCFAIIIFFIIIIIVIVIAILLVGCFGPADFTIVEENANLLSWKKKLIPSSIYLINKFYNNAINDHFYRMCFCIWRPDDLNLIKKRQDIYYWFDLLPVLATLMNFESYSLRMEHITTILIKKSI